MFAKPFECETGTVCLTLLEGKGKWLILHFPVGVHSRFALWMHENVGIKGFRFPTEWSNETFPCHFLILLVQYTRCLNNNATRTFPQTNQMKMRLWNEGSHSRTLICRNGKVYVACTTLVCVLLGPHSSCFVGGGMLLMQGKSKTRAKQYSKRQLALLWKQTFGHVFSSNLVALPLRLFLER